MGSYTKRYTLFRKHFFAEFAKATERKKVSLEDEAVLLRLWDAYWEGDCQPVSSDPSALAELLDVEVTQVQSMFKECRGFVVDGDKLSIPNLDEQYRQAVRYSEEQAKRRRLDKRGITAVNQSESEA